jgi:GNAT superfamily N-acetyltransferase
VFVLAEHRYAGVGTALHEAAVAHARREGFVRLVLNPSERSVPLYERFGFRPSRLLQLDLEE